jgi:hypothetical protein
MVQLRSHTTVVHQLNDPDREAILNSANWYLQTAHEEEKDTALVCFSKEG